MSGASLERRVSTPGTPPVIPVHSGTLSPLNSDLEVGDFQGVFQNSNVKVAFDIKT